jgi:hypothetical protein
VPAGNSPEGTRVSRLVAYQETISSILGGWVGLSLDYDVAVADSTATIPYNLSPFSVVMKQVKPQQCPLNVIYIRALRGHCSIYIMGEGKYLL